MQVSTKFWDSEDEVPNDLTLRGEVVVTLCGLATLERILSMLKTTLEMSSQGEHSKVWPCA
jgi:hypothetical protein